MFNLKKQNRIMKKTYIAPELYIQFVQLEGLIALSTTEKPADESDGLVKEDRNGRTDRHYNVWDDDWNQDKYGH